MIDIKFSMKNNQALHDLIKEVNALKQAK